MIWSDWFSDCGSFRYSLSCRWAPGLSVVAILCNPSRATALVRDPTTSQNINRFRRMGFGRYEAVNVCAAVGTDPDMLKQLPDPVGPGNEAAIRTALEGADLVVVMFGSHPVVRQYLPRILPLIQHRPLWCLGINKDGMPRFPRAIPRDTRLVLWHPPI